MISILCHYIPPGLTPRLRGMNIKPGAGVAFYGDGELDGLAAKDYSGHCWVEHDGPGHPTNGDVWATVNNPYRDLAIPLDDAMRCIENRVAELVKACPNCKPSVYDMPPVGYAELGITSETDRNTNAWYHICQQLAWLAPVCYIYPHTANETWTACAKRVLKLALKMRRPRQKVYAVVNHRNFNTKQLLDKRELAVHIQECLDVEFEGMKPNGVYLFHADVFDGIPTAVDDLYDTLRFFRDRWPT